MAGNANSGRKRSKAMHRDRITNTKTGETGTIIDAHHPKNAQPRYTVLPDGPGVTATVLWEDGEAVWEPPSDWTHCYRCGEDGHDFATCEAWRKDRA